MQNLPVRSEFREPMTSTEFAVWEVNNYLSAATLQECHGMPLLN
jgi:hypothetical protein